MMHNDDISTSTAFDKQAQELTATLRAAFDAWVRRDATNPDEEIWIATELLVKGIFGFAAPLLVNTLNLETRGAQTITQWFAEHLDRAIQERRSRQQTRRSHLIADPDDLPDEDDNDEEDGESTKRRATDT